jgi:hypothetical protein
MLGQTQSMAGLRLALSNSTVRVAFWNYLLAFFVPHHMQSPNQRKPLQSPDIKRHSLARVLTTGRQVSSPRSSTPTYSSPLRSATIATVTTSPPRVLTGIAKDSVLTKQVRWPTLILSGRATKQNPQADAAITELETNLQNHTDQIFSKRMRSSTLNTLGDSRYLRSGTNVRPGNRSR